MFTYTHTNYLLLLYNNDHTHTHARIRTVMPEFRFRRKKQQDRRHTLHNQDETSKQVKVAKQQIQESVKPVKPGDEKRNSLVQEREKFFELLKNKYPEQANDLEVQQVLSNGEEEEHVEEAGLNSGSAPFGIEDVSLSVCALPCMWLQPIHLYNTAHLHNYELHCVIHTTYSAMYTV